MKKTMALLVLLALMFAGCSGDDLRDSMAEDLMSGVVFYDTDSSEIASVSYRIGTVLTVDMLPTEETEGFGREGYTISGWTTQRGSEEGRIVSSITVPPQSLPLYVFGWKPISYIVVFDGNGGEFDGGATSVSREFVYDEGQEIQSISGITPKPRNGYIFKGWSCEDNRNAAKPTYADTDTLINLTTKKDDIVTLYACWLRDEITISFEPNGGTGNMDAVEGFKVDTPLPPNTFTPPKGMYFAGWAGTLPDGKEVLYSDSKLIDESNYPNNDITLYAQWAWIPIEITFDKNADDAEGDMRVQCFEYGQPQDLSPNAFRRYKYYFAGWKGENGNQTYADGALATFEPDILSFDYVTKEPIRITLKAQWEYLTVHITFDANGGEGSMNAGTYRIGDMLPQNTFTPPQTGQYFTGWIDDRGWRYGDKATIETIMSPNENITLKAQWAWIPIVMTFAKNADDATGNMGSQSFAYGQPQTLSANKFSRHGYDFAGWKDGSKLYGDGESVAFTPDTSSFNPATGEPILVTLSAQWKAQTVVITFTPSDGSGDVSIQEVSFDTLPQSLKKNTFTRTGWNFDGWMSTTGVAFADGETITSANWNRVYNGGKITLAAVWTPRGIVTSSSKEIAWKEVSEGLVFTAPQGVSYQWMLRPAKETLSQSDEQSCTIRYADFDSDTAEYTIYVIVFTDVDGIEIPQTYYAKFHVDPQR